MKSIANPQQIRIHPKITHVVGNFSFKLRHTPIFYRFWCKEPCNFRNVFWRYDVKGVSYFVCNFSTAIGFSAAIAQELMCLHQSSKKNNIEEVNSVVKSLLSNSNF